MSTVAALYVYPGGCYDNLPNVELWDQERDARTYPGPHPVVAHPPCSRWCQLAGLVEARYGYKKGDDDGCFQAALSSVRTHGGVLEHPAYSNAFPTYGIPSPDVGMGWERTICGGWVTHVEQHAYGHPARKATWLYAVTPTPPPPLNWTLLPPGQATHLVSWNKNNVSPHESRPRIGKKAAALTPPPFRDALLQIASLCHP